MRILSATADDDTAFDGGRVVAIHMHLARTASEASVRISRRSARLASFVLGDTGWLLATHLLFCLTFSRFRRLRTRLADKEHLEVVGVLLQRGADINLF